MAAPLKRPAPDRLLRLTLPALVLAASVGLWEALCRVYAVPPFMLPTPSLIAVTIVEDWRLLAASWLVTARTTAMALALALVGGVGLAVLLTRSKLIELTFAPYAVILQVTPLIAIAPLLLLYLDVTAATLVCAFIVAFFPVLSNAVTGLQSADHHLRDLFELHGASAWQILRRLELMSALPFILTGLKIGGGLALIGAVVGEISAGAVGQGAGLAARIIESFYRLNIPRAYAALTLVSLTGVVIYAATSLTAHLALRRWHESALARET